MQHELYRGLQAPQKTNRRFYPSKATIRGHIYKSVIKEKFSKIDQEDLQKKVRQWKVASPDDSFQFHPYAMYSSEEENRPQHGDKESGSDSEEEDEEIVKTSTKGLLFVHQTKDQRRLLERYGNEMYAGRHVQDNAVQSPPLLCCRQDQRRLSDRRFVRDPE